MSASNTFYRKIRKRGSLSLPALFFLFLFFTATAFAESPEKCHAWIPVFRGVDYLFLHQETPLPQRIHLVKIDLKDPAIRFTSTPPNTEKARRETRCETTLAFVKEKKAQLGINGNFFINDHQEDTDLLGLAVSDGTVVSLWDKGWAKYAVNIAEDNQVTFVARPEGGENTSETVPPVKLFNALTGNIMLVEDGKVKTEEEGDRHPRTAVGLTADQKMLFLIADGRQPGHCTGLTYHDMATLFVEFNAVSALALDGGGSSTLVLADPEPRVVNVPLPATVPEGIVLNPPGVERKNGNNLAVFAAPLESRQSGESSAE
ncbi:MAG TPA: phosphodiester glycosidase family protein [Candidatus Hydrogenedentes bacterium]|nr:phosphodiester glycosidase family protein [Candidatus Hydrogenedentota bacterium]